MVVQIERKEARMPILSYQSLSAVLGWDGEATPTDSQIEQVLEMVRPAPSAQDRCRLDAIDAVRIIAKCVPRTEAPGMTKKQLIHLVTCLKRTRVAMKQLPPAWFDRLAPPKDVLHDLDRVCLNAESLEAKIVVTRGGGAKCRRADALRKLLAADYASGLLRKWGSAPLTLTKGGRWIELANRLFFIATGRHGNCERACATHLKQLRRDRAKQVLRMRPAEICVEYPLSA
jgi:hypothetical protein